MRLPQHLIESPLFLFQEVRELIAVLGDRSDPSEAEQIIALTQRRLPPITSVYALAAMIGLNPGIIWSFINRPRKHYRVFKIQQGSKIREITAPKIGLKIIQKWLSYHLGELDIVAPHVFGFVPGRSHIQAAFLHRGADWAYSVDIASFFQTTPITLVHESLCKLGYSSDQSKLICSLTCLNGVLAQGAPSSPPISNICFTMMDDQLALVAQQYNCTLTRYADDIVFSGSGAFPDNIKQTIYDLFSTSPWTLSEKKERIEPLKGRIKVHGFIVNGDKVRLTKGYRNKLRAYRHIANKYGDNAENNLQIKGHLNYSDYASFVIDKLYDQFLDGKEI